MIRSAEEKDIPAVQYIAKQSWQDTYEGIIPSEIQEIFLDRAYSHPMMLKRLEKTMLLLAEHNNEPIGFANFTKVDEDLEAELTAIYLLPSYQKMGYGSKLLQEGLSYLKKAERLFVYVECDNQKGRLFYEKLGFTCVEEFEELFEGYKMQTAKYVLHIE